MSRYAQRTEVASDKTRRDIEVTLQRYGATAFLYGWNETTASIMFEIAGRRIRFLLPMPDRHDRRFTHTESRGIERTVEAAEREFDQAIRQRWRALLLVIKAKLEAVDSGICTLEEEFLANVVLPDGSTVGEWASPQLEVAYGNGQMPALLPGGAR